MMRARVRALLDDVAAGRATVEQALSALDAEPIEALGHSVVDHHRAVRSGYPEVVYAEGKTVAQVVDVCAAIAAHSGTFLVTRADDVQRAALVERFPEAVASTLARTVRWASVQVPARGDGGTVLVVTAGTSDLPVAE